MKAKKSLGQNFLIDKNIISKIVTEASACNDDLIIEINNYNYNRIKTKLKGLSPMNYRLQSSN